jgi:hypothetical protein
LQIEDATLRDWIHVCEVFPEGIEDLPKYMGWGFSLFSRAARMGECNLALNVLEIAREDQAQYDPGQPPPCWKVNEIVKTQKARVAGATQDELDKLRAEAERHALSRFTGSVLHSELMGRDVVIVPPDRLIRPGDEVIVIKKGQA